MYVCLCKAVKDTDIKQFIAEGGAGIEDLKTKLGVGSGCGICQTAAEKLLREAIDAEASLFSRAS